MMILCVDLEMLGEVIDALTEKRDLDFGRPGVAVVCLVCSDDAAFPVPV
jgi:hypothetical protein